MFDRRHVGSPFGKALKDDEHAITILKQFGHNKDNMIMDDTKSVE